MSKRPKLSLSSLQQNTKKRPSTFEVATAPSKPTRNALPKPPARPTASTLPPPSVSVSATTRAKRADGSPSKQTTWISAGAIAKAVLIVGAAALSIFLLRRRLY